MSKVRMLVVLGLVAVGTGSLLVPSATAANSPTFRDCSLFVSGFDPDFVQISGVMVSPEGTLTVPRSQKQVPIEASESSDPGDSLGHVTLTVSVTALHVPTQSVSGEATGKVELSAPLVRRKPGSALNGFSGMCVLTKAARTY